MNERTSADRGYHDVEYVGPHIVIAKQEWVPGPHPEAHRRDQGQTEYVESYFRCVRCGAERLSKREFPDECDEDPLEEALVRTPGVHDQETAEGAEPTEE
jgi:hypothetical protein